jgi:hypothetical protein
LSPSSPSPSPPPHGQSLGSLVPATASSPLPVGHDEFDDGAESDESLADTADAATAAVTAEASSSEEPPSDWTMAEALSCLKEILPVLENNVMFASLKEVYRPVAESASVEQALARKGKRLLGELLAQPDRGTSLVAAAANDVLGAAVALLIRSKAHLLIPMYFIMT